MLNTRGTQRILQHSISSFTTASIPWGASSLGTRSKFVAIINIFRLPACKCLRTSFRPTRYRFFGGPNYLRPLGALCLRRKKSSFSFNISLAVSSSRSYESTISTYSRAPRLFPHNPPVSSDLCTVKCASASGFSKPLEPAPAAWPLLESISARIWRQITVRSLKTFT